MFLWCDACFSFVILPPARRLCFMVDLFVSSVYKKSFGLMTFFGRLDLAQVWSYQGLVRGQHARGQGQGQLCSRPSPRPVVFKAKATNFCSRGVLEVEDSPWGPHPWKLLKWLDFSDHVDFFIDSGSLSRILFHWEIAAALSLLYSSDGSTVVSGSFRSLIAYNFECLLGNRSCSVWPVKGSAQTNPRTRSSLLGVSLTWIIFIKFDWLKNW